MPESAENASFTDSLAYNKALLNFRLFIDSGFLASYKAPSFEGTGNEENIPTQ